VIDDLRLVIEETQTVSFPFSDLGQTLKPKTLHARIFA
jgi:hypothetical protein